MITVEDREKIRRAYFIEKKSQRQIARELRCSRDTVRKAIESAEPDRYTLAQPRPAPILGPYKARIDELLAENERLPRKQRYIGHTIYKDIQAKGYRGSESTVRGYIARRRREKRRPQVYIPLEFDPGTDAQVDWGEAEAIIAGERITVQVFFMRLCYSRKLFVMAFPAQKQEAFFEGHVRAFHHFQGVPQRISYDNLKAAVQRVLEGRTRQEQQKFIVFRSHYLFESHFCTPGQGHEKGRVEDGVGFGRRNFLVPMPEVASFDELNAHLLAACLDDDERRIDRQPTTIGAAWEMEKPYLLPLPKQDFDCCVVQAGHAQWLRPGGVRDQPLLGACQGCLPQLGAQGLPVSDRHALPERRDRQPSTLLRPKAGYPRSLALSAAAGAASRRFRPRQADPALAGALATGLRTAAGPAAGAMARGEGGAGVRPHPEAAPGASR